MKAKLSDPRFTINNLYRIVDKKGQSIPFKMNWAQQDMFENMHNRNIILKARQIGSTTFWCVYFLNKALFQSNQRLGIISYSLTSAHDIFAKIIKHAYSNLPTKVSMIPQFAIVKDSAREIEFANGSSIRVDTSMRSGTLSGLLITEFGKICARYPNKAEEIMTGSINTVSTDALCVIESTAEGSAGQFYDMWQQAQKNDLDTLNELQWKPFFYPWHKHIHEYSLHNDDIKHPKYLQEYYESLDKQYGINLTNDQMNWYTMKYTELGDQIKQEYPSTDDEAFMLSSDGYWYLKEVNEARQEGRITNVPYQPQTYVYTAWDLGFRDSTSIWFFQLLPSGAVHIIDYYENSGEGLHHYAAHINTLPYKAMIKIHFMPHDAAAHDLVSGLSVAKQAKELGMDVQILNRNSVGRTKFMLEVQRCRTLIKRCYFDSSKTAAGIKCLENYRKKWNESMASYTDEALHDWASHGSDAFRYMAQAIETVVRRPDGATLEEERKKIKAARRRRV